MPMLVSAQRNFTDTVKSLAAVTTHSVVDSSKCNTMTTRNRYYVVIEITLPISKCIQNILFTKCFERVNSGKESISLFCSISGSVKTYVWPPQSGWVRVRTKTKVKLMNVNFAVISIVVPGSVTGPNEACSMSKISAPISRAIIMPPPNEPG